MSQPFSHKIYSFSDSRTLHCRDNIFLQSENISSTRFYSPRGAKAKPRISDNYNLSYGHKARSLVRSYSHTSGNRMQRAPRCKSAQKQLRAVLFSFSGSTPAQHLVGCRTIRHRDRWFLPGGMFCFPPILPPLFQQSFPRP